MATTERTSAVEVARGYFAAIEAGDRGAQRAWYHDEMRGTIHGIVHDATRDELIAWFDDLYAAFPDLRFEVLDLTGTAKFATIRWRISGTFAGPGSFQGFEPTGARVVTEGCDVLWAHDGKVHRIEAYTDGMTIARQLGAMPPQGSGAEEAMARAFNVKTRAGRVVVAEPEAIADGVWIVRGGFPMKTMNVYLLRDGDGVLMFDAGIAQMTAGLRAIGARMGGITRIVLGHGHVDHRGAAPGLDAPVFCHPDEIAMAESEDGGLAEADLSLLNPVARMLYRRLLPMWDGGPVHVAGTVDEGENVAGFEVVHVPGHAPGQIALWRERDRLALTTDCFYTLDVETTRKGVPRVPHAAFTPDVAAARASIRKVAALGPDAAWPGHAEPVRGDVRAQLERAADR